jgi:A/G-specific adenine glycosylase
VAAILSFGFRQRATAVDGNVFRVVTRYAWIDEDIGKMSGKRRVEDFVHTFLSLKQPWITAEALIELGATICTPIPRCGDCPLRASCVSYLKGQPMVLPIKSLGPRLEKIVRGVAIIEACDHILVRKNPSGQLMGDLWEFPYFEKQRSASALRKELRKLLGLTPALVRQMEPVTHSFTRFSAKLFPFYFVAANSVQVTGYTWVPFEELDQLSFSAGHRKIMKEVIQLHR